MSRPPGLVRPQGEDLGPVAVERLGQDRKEIMTRDADVAEHVLVEHSELPDDAAP